MNQTTNDLATAQAAQIVKQVIKSWETQNKTVADFFSKYDDDCYQHEIAPGRNRAIYLFGHLIGMNDFLLPMLDLGDKLFPALEPIFVTSPDKAITDLPSVSSLKEYWNKLNQQLAGSFAAMDTDTWLQRHTKVTAEDFALDPGRNKLNVLMERINHTSYHLGQLALLNPKK